MQQNRDYVLAYSAWASQVTCVQGF